MHERWFIFDLGNVVVKLDYRRVIANICADASLGGAELVALLEQPGGYRDLERGKLSFSDLHRWLSERAGYHGDLERLRAIWTDFFAGPIPGIENVLERVRREYRLAYLSNSNEVHAESIPRVFAHLFRPGEPFIFSHEQGCAKPDALIFTRALEILDTQPSRCLYVDDLQENVDAAAAVGMNAFLFHSSELLLETLESEGLLGRSDVTVRGCSGAD